MPHLLATFPVELRLHISQYLTAQELQAASSSCKQLYQLFANQAIWEYAYNSLLNGYPGNNFVVTQLVRESKRLDFLAFDRPLTLKWLEDWRTSWKQRTTFILHIIKVQSEVVSVARQRTNKLFDQTEGTPVFSTEFITDMEFHLGAKFPIDFVVFLQNFAHQVTFSTERNNDDSDDPMLFQMPELASRREFQHFETRQRANPRATFTADDKRRLFFNKMHSLPVSNQIYLDKITIACFSRVEYGSEYDWEHELETDGNLEFGEYHLGMVLSTDQGLKNEVPSTIDSEEPHDTSKSIICGIGKVVFKGVHPLDSTSIHVHTISESFTDYFVQWGSIAIVRRDSDRRHLNGCIDFVKTLPKHLACQSSILLPQYMGWSVGKYAPIYFSLETHTSIPTPLSFLLYCTTSANRIGTQAGLNRQAP